MAMSGAGVESVRAVRWHGRGDLRMECVPRPPHPGPDELQLRVLWCGICGTDIEEWRNGPIFIPADEPHPLTGARAPLVLGHELTGEVVAVGPGVGIPVGTVVAVDGLSGCGECRWCREGRIVLCPSLSAVGLMSDGGLAEFVNVPAHGSYPVPPELPADEAILAETLACGVRALSRGRVGPDDAVLVVGAGAVGILAAQAARARGARQVLVVDTDPWRVDVARGLGLDAREEWPIDGADVVLECSGNARAAGRAVACLRPGGRAVLVGLYSEPLCIDALTVVTGEREVLGSLSHVYSSDFREALEMLATGAVSAAPLISRRIGLDEAIDTVRALAADPSTTLKVVISPMGSPSTIDAEVDNA
jgi:(R,R)-butanediol dehydrogenase/meso-butanediol dehydrogenase/diacetyl reductase